MQKPITTTNNIPGLARLHLRRLLTRLAITTQPASKAGAGKPRVEKQLACHSMHLGADGPLKFCPMPEHTVDDAYSVRRARLWPRGRINW